MMEDKPPQPRVAAHAGARSAIAPWPRGAVWTVGLAMTACLAGCSPRHLIVQGAADALSVQGAAGEEDPILARDAAPFYLKTAESVLREAPDHLALGTAVAAGFTQYAYAWVAFEADQAEGHDVRRAARERARAAALYRRAQRHAVALLERRHPGFVDQLVGDRPPPPDARLVDLAYWGAAAWGGWISLAKDVPDVVADLPRAVALARWAHAQAPDHREGALASLLGTFEAARPGGSVAQAEALFVQARQAAGAKPTAVLVAMAEALALPAGDRARYEALLRDAVAAAGPSPDLATRVMLDRARWLLDTADQRF